LRKPRQIRNTKDGIAMKRTEAQSANRSRDQEQDGEYGGGEAIAKLQVHCPLEDVNLYTC